MAKKKTASGRGKNKDRTYYKFTTKDDAWLTKNYPTALWEKIFTRFPELNKGQIEGHARRVLKLFREKPGFGVEWPVKDSNLVKKHYPRSTKSEIMSVLPGRSWSSIQLEAQRLGVEREHWGHGEKWTDAEKAKLTELYPKASLKQLRLALPNRSEQKIRNMAGELGLVREVYWTNERKAVLKALWTTASWEDIRRAFPDRTRETISARARALDLVRTPNAGKPKTPEVSTEEIEAAKKKALDEKMDQFLARARTEDEFIHKFGEGSIETLKDRVANPPEGFVMKNGVNNFQQKTYYLSRVVVHKRGEQPAIKKRVFSTMQSDNDPDYLAIIFPPDLSFTKDKEMEALKIFPIDSSYWGDHLCDKQRLIKYINWLESKPYAFAFLNGDNIGGTGYNKWTAADHCKSFSALLRPVAHKILWAQSGDLELNMQRIDGIDPLRHVCHELGIHHTDRPVMADIYWRSPMHPIEITAIHGRSNASQAGAMVNAVNKMAIAQNFPHFTVLGHLQAAHSEANTVRRLDPVNLTIKEHVAYSVIAPGFRRYEGSIQEKKGLPPKPKGTVVIKIKANNDFLAES